MRTLLLLFFFVAVGQTKYISSDESTVVDTGEDNAVVKSTGQAEDIKYLRSDEPADRVKGGDLQRKTGKRENCTRKFKEAEESLLSGLKVDEKKEFFSIRSDDSLSANQKSSRIHRWATKCGKEAELTVYLKKKEQWKREKSEELDTILDTLGDKIKAIQEIVNDDDLVKLEQKEQIGAILKECSDSVDRMLNSLYPHYLTRTKRSYHRNPYPEHHQRDHHQRHPEHHSHGTLQVDR